MESQFDYYRNQCDKFEKSNRKYEQQLHSLRGYVEDLQSVKARRPKKTANEDVNKERQARFEQ